MIGFIVEVLNYQKLFTESDLANWFSNYVQFVQVVISQNELNCSVVWKGASP